MTPAATLIGEPTTVSAESAPATAPSSSTAHRTRQAPRPDRGPDGAVGALWRAMRPHQWIKNGLLLAAPLAAEALVSGDHLLRCVIGVAAFCLAASATYLVNDCVDAERDRLHPVKCHRPVAAGQLPKPVAYTVAVLLGIAALATATWLGWAFAAVLVLYLLLTFAYSTLLKRVPIVELAGVASGFLLRGIAGAVALHLPVRGPFLLTISFAALFLVVGKRHGDVLALGEDAEQHRSTLGAYSPQFLGQLLTISTTGTLLSYALWAFSLQHGEPGWPWPSVSVLPFAVGLLRALQLVLDGAGADPADLLRDRGLRAAVGVTATLLMIGLLR